jgi:2-[hydroxy(phenyl)methyl]-succinyl-CoA dehydrogenase BbsD subunit
MFTRSREYVLCYTARMSFVDRVVLVTGAGRGFGRTLAERFARAGASVVANDVNPDACAATARAITDSGGRARAIAADVANKMAVQTMHYEILETWERVDVLINNARVEPAGAALTLDEWAWDRTINVNLKGAFLCTQTVGRSMKAQGGGIIVNILGRAGDPPAYAASQMGLVGLTRTCAREFAAYHVRVNAVCLGTAEPANQTETQMKKEIGDLAPVPPGLSGDAAERVMFLCSEQAAHLTGQVFGVDEGAVE